MRFLFVSIASLAVLLCGFSGCASHSKTKTVNHIYNGDAPSVHYYETETAGGRLRTF